MSFVKPAAVLRALQLGFAVMVAGAGKEPAGWRSLGAGSLTIGNAACKAVRSSQLTASAPASPTHTHTLSPADTDVAYAVKPLWDSYLAFIQAGDADGAWQEEKPRECWWGACCCVCARPHGSSALAGDAASHASHSHNCGPCRTLLPAHLPAPILSNSPPLFAGSDCCLFSQLGPLCAASHAGGRQLCGRMARRCAGDAEGWCD